MGREERGGLKDQRLCSQKGPSSLARVVGGTWTWPLYGSEGVGLCRMCGGRGGAPWALGSDLNFLSCFLPCSPPTPFMPFTSTLPLPPAPPGPSAPDAEDEEDYDS